MATPKRIVTVTGATGFVGKHVVRRLLEQPDTRVRCLLRSTEGAPELAQLGDRISFCQGDIMRKASLTAAFKCSWGVVNVAGYREFWSADRARFYDINEEGARNVFEACLDRGGL